DPGAALLVVHIAALAPATLDKWRSENVLRIAAQAGAGTALKAAHDRQYQIVYLATAADSARLYAKMRGWIDNQWAGAEPFPAGPVLATLGGTTVQTVRELKTRFGGPLVVVAGNSESAKALRDVGGRLIVIGGDAVEPPAVRVE